MLAGLCDDEPVNRDPERPARLLRAEHDALLPILRRARIRLFAGRPVEPSEYRLAGATPEELVVF